MAVEILHVRSRLAFEDAAKAALKALGVAAAEEHDSENYPGGTYFLGRIGQLKIKVTIESDTPFADCQYWVVLQAAQSADDLESIVMDSAKRLLSAGFQVLRGARETKHEVERVEYRLDQSGNLAERERERVATTEPRG